MEDERITVIFSWHERELIMDLDIPLNITANELIIGLNEGLKLGMDTRELPKCYLKTENPIAFIRGNKLLKD